MKKKRNPPLPPSQERAEESLGALRRRLAALAARVQQEFRDGASMVQLSHKHSLPLGLVEEILRAAAKPKAKSKPQK